MGRSLPSILHTPTITFHHPITISFIHCKDYFVADVGHVHHRDSVVGSRSRVSGSEKGGEGRGWPSATRRGSRRRDGHRTELNKRTGCYFDCLTTYTGMSYILWASRRPCGTYKAGWWLCTPSDSELGTRSLGLGVPLGSAEHGRWVAGDLWGTLDVDPNPNRILPLHHHPCVWD